MRLHIDYCKDFGVTKEEIEKTEESQGMFERLELYALLIILVACTAYTRFLNAANSPITNR
jgi:hypothetical protein